MLPGVPARSKAFSITVIAACQVAAMSLWFSASAVLPALTVEFHLTAFTQAALTSAVQLGFVVGCVASAVTGLPDRGDPRRLFALSAFVGALVAEPMHLVGHSRGGHVAFRVAQHFPDRVRTLVLAEPGGTVAAG